MNLSEEGLNQIEQHAYKKKDVNTMFMIQILREMREIKALFVQTKDSCYSSNYSPKSTDEGKN